MVMKVVKVFLSYADRDEDLRDELVKHLSTLEKNGKIKVWHRGDIMGGNNTKNEINEHRQDSEIILLLLSSDFIAHNDEEIKGAMERHRKGEVQVIPIILRPCDWKKLLSNKLQALPKNHLSITKWENQDEAFEDVVKGIGEVVDPKDYNPAFKEKIDNYKNELKKLISSQKISYIEGNKIKLISTFDETNKKELLYIPPNVKKTNDEKLSVDEWLKSFLDFKEVENEQENKVMFIEAPLGSGKSSLCLHIIDLLTNDKIEGYISGYIPVLVRFKYIEQLEPDLEKFLKNAIEKEIEIEFDDQVKKENVDFFEVQNTPLLTSPIDRLKRKNLRFLFLLDGPSEFTNSLDLQKTVLGDLLQNLINFSESQNEYDHRFLITSRISLENLSISDKEKYERVQISQIDEFRKTWITNWKKVVKNQKKLSDSYIEATDLGNNFESFINNFIACCLDENDEHDKIFHEPLSLLALAVKHKSGKFSGAKDIIKDIKDIIKIKAENINAENINKDIKDIKEKHEDKIKEVEVEIYQELLDWILTEQRSELANQRLTQLPIEDLKLTLEEAALCVVQSGGKAEKNMLTERLPGSLPIHEDHPADRRFRQAKKSLKGAFTNNAISTFYIRLLDDKDKDKDKYEFSYSNFRQFLFASRIKNSLELWASELIDNKSVEYTKNENEIEITENKKINNKIYDLLGYGSIKDDFKGLDKETLGYLKQLLKSNDCDFYCGKDYIPAVVVFKYLEYFYRQWLKKNSDSDKEVHFTKELTEELKEKIRKLYRDNQKSDEAILNIVNVYTELNVMILLLELHRYAIELHRHALNQDNSELEKMAFLKREMTFYPCGQNGSPEFEKSRLKNIIKKCNTHLNDQSAFTQIVGLFMSKTRLNEAELCGDVDLTEVDLSEATLTDANLSHTILKKAKFRNAVLISTDLSDAILEGADFTKATLNSAVFNDKTVVKNTKFREAYLGGADFTSADLSGADFTNAILCSANFENAKFQGATYEGADWTGLRGIDITKIDENENIPPDLKQYLKDKWKEWMEE